MATRLKFPNLAKVTECLDYCFFDGLRFENADISLAFLMTFTYHFPQDSISEGSLIYRISEAVYNLDYYAVYYLKSLVNEEILYYDVLGKH